MRVRVHILRHLFFAHLTGVAFAQPQLLLDLNRQPLPPLSSSPSRAVVVGDHVWFAATTAAAGLEPWIVDAAGTAATPLGDLMPGPQGSNPREFIAFAGGVLFAAIDPLGGDEPWFAAPFVPPRRIADIVPGAGGSTPSGFAVTSGGSRAFFVADDGVHGAELWTTDGTAAGTRLVRDVFPGPAPSYLRNLVAFGAGVAFVADDGQHGYELWVSDGTAAGTRMVLDLNPGAAWGFGAIPPLAFGSRLLFAGDDGQRGVELWSTDGTAAGTTLVADLGAGGSGSNPRGFVLAGSGLAAFVIGNSAQGYLPCSTDGTAAGTRALTFARSSVPEMLADGTGRIFFVASDALTGGEVWVSDGTPAGTRAIDFTTGPGSTNPELLAANGGFAYFLAPTGLYRTNGTVPGTIALAPRHILPSYPAQPWLVAMRDGSAYFAASTPSTGNELWRSDGTPAGTGLFADLEPARPTADGDPRLLAVVGGRALFLALTGSGVRTLFSTDGTTAQTVPIAGLPEVWSLQRDIGGFALLASGFPATLWSSDGTPGNTRLLGGVRPLQTNFEPSESGAALDGGRVLFGGTAIGSSDGELWITDGTDPGTALLRDIHPTASATPAQFVRAGSRVYLTADDGVHGRELWRSDGTPSGTALVRDIRPGSGGSDIKILGRAGDRLLMAADDGVVGRELWRADETGATLVGDLTINYSTIFLAAASTGSRRVFAARGTTAMATVYGTDGSSAVALPIQPSSLPNFTVYALAAAGSQVLVAAGDSRLLIGSPELYLTDGTPAGTRRLSVALPSGALWFATTVGTTHAAFFIRLPSGRAQLFLVEGASGRVQAAGTIGLPENGNPARPMLANGELLFPGWDPIHGLELWRTAVGPIAEREGLGCGEARVDLSADQPRAGGVVTFATSGARAFTVLLLGIPPPAPLLVSFPARGCALFVDHNRAFLVPFAMGADELSVPIPTSSRLLRVRLTAQVVTGPTATGLDLSNGVRLTLDL